MDFETTMAMIGDKNPTEFRVDSVSDADRAKIDNGLEMVFSGLTLLAWLDGERLGDAWRGALDKMRPIGFDITKPNAAVLYLRQANIRHRQTWTNKIVSSRNASDFINCPADQTDVWRERGNNQLRDGMELIRQTIAKFTPVYHAPKKTILNTNVHSAEHTYEYERVRKK